MAWNLRRVPEGYLAEDDQGTLPDVLIPRRPYQQEWMLDSDAEDIKTLLEEGEKSGDLESELDSIRDRLSEKEDEVENLTRQVEKLGPLVESLEESNSSYSDTLTENEVEIEALKSQVLELETTLAEREARLKLIEGISFISPRRVVRSTTASLGATSQIQLAPRNARQAPQPTSSSSSLDGVLIPREGDRVEVWDGDEAPKPGDPLVVGVDTGPDPWSSQRKGAWRLARRDDGYAGGGPSGEWRYNVKFSRVLERPAKPRLNKTAISEYPA